MIDVGVLRIAIDGRVSKFVQTELARIMTSTEAVSAQGRSNRLREVSVLLRRVRDSWIYGGAVNDPIRSDVEAGAAFSKHVDDARVRSRVDAVPATPPDDPATTLILVSIIIAARGETVTVSEVGAGEELRRALEAAVHRSPDDIVALEVVWIQLEAQHPPPDLYRLRGEVVGNAYCNYCGGPFPAELASLSSLWCPRAWSRS